MEKELYNELVDKLFITDVTLTLDDINNKEVKLEDIITQPAAYSYYAEKLKLMQLSQPSRLKLIQLNQLRKKKLLLMKLTNNI